MAFATSQALAFRGHVFEGAFGEKGAGDGQFSEPEGVAVNEATGDVYVVDQGNKRIEWFSATGAFMGQFNGSGVLPNEEGKKAPEPLSFVANVAVDNACHLHEQETHKTLSASQCEAFDPSNGDVYIPSGKYNSMAVDKFTATGAFITQITLPLPPKAVSSGAIEGVAVDPRGELWVADHPNVPGEEHPEFVDNYGNAVINEYRGFRKASSSTFGSSGLALDSVDRLYIRIGAGLVNEFNANGELLNPAVTGESSASNGVAVELSTDDLYIDNGESVVRFGPNGALAANGLPIERLSVPGEQGRGLTVDSATGRIYVAEATGVVDVYELEPPAAPKIGSESVSEVTATSAGFQGEVNPRSEPTESPTTYRFAYGPCDSASTCATSPYELSLPAPDGRLAPAYEPDPVSVHAQDLVPGTVYHFRVIAQNALGSTEGEERVFTTQSPGSSALPDAREWELVSPPDKHGADILPIFGPAPGTQAAAGGGAMAYVTTAPTEAEPAGNSNYTQVLSTRGPGGWGSRDLAIPHNQATGYSNSVSEYRVFSSDLSLSVVHPFGTFNPLLSEEASEQTAYLRTDYLHGDPSDFCKTSCYRPLVTGAPGFANVPPGTEFGISAAKERCPPFVLCGPQILGATPDLSHIVLYSSVALTPGGGAYYEWSGGQLQPVDGIGQGPSHETGYVLPTVVRNAISTDGSRVYFSGGVSEGIGTPQARTVVVPGGAFQTASADGSRAFLLGGGDLSEFDLETEASVLLASGVMGVIGASEDGSVVYFVSAAVLTSEEENGQGEKAESGQANLYVSRAGSTVFIATLSGEDSPDWEYGSSERRMTARVSPDGHWIAFMSQRPLTGYDNRDTVSGVSDQEVYLYHAAASTIVGGGGGGTLVCASCDPTGARPHGIEYSRLAFGTGLGLVGGGTNVRKGSQWLAANVPAWTSPYHQSRYLSDAGRLFFNSSDALVPQDTNGTEDVYQYEPPGVGDCTEESAIFGRASGGCVGLISSGTSPEESGFLDASESGGDVYFLTAAKLSSVDVDSAIDVYDAHECSVSSLCPAPPPPPAPACEGDACQSPAEAPNDPTPGSLTFNGPDNPVTPALAKTVVKAKPLTRAQRLSSALKACGKKPRKKRAFCERQARRAYGPVGKAKKTLKGVR